MAPARPYQPLPFRLLHSTVAVLVILALLTGFWVYNTYDRRWGSLPLPPLSDIQGLHGTVALTLLLVWPVFALYSFHGGTHRLIPPKPWGSPQLWISRHRLANLGMLAVVTAAMLTGRMMKEEWLPAGELNHAWYLAHLGTWLAVGVGLGSHIVLGAKAGGLSLLQSVFGWKIRPQDTPKQWWRSLRKQLPAWLWLVELGTMGGTVLAFLLPLFSS
ncbi:MAG: cytochrome b/b6 domain-containing protein [Pseudanabaenaceae cyanobacterium]